MTSWSILAALAAALQGPSAMVHSGRVGADPAEERVGYRRDPNDRMTVPVTIDGRGPFRFVVDTGAERTVIARELAAQLQLDASRSVLLASLADVQQVPTVIIPRLGVGRRTLDEIVAPALLQEHLGAQGMLGVDSLQSQRVTFDFRRRELRLARSNVEDERWPADTIVVRGRTRLGRMVLADVNVNGQRVQAIVDTGSPITIGNEALRDRLVRSGRLQPDQMIELTSVTGAQVRVGYTTIPRVRIGTARINDLPIAFAGLHLFRELGLGDRPAILLGMDALQLFERASIDFGTRRLRLLPGPSSEAPAARQAP